MMMENGNVGQTAGPVRWISPWLPVVLALFLLTFSTSEVIPATVAKKFTSDRMTEALIGETVLQNGVPFNTSLPALTYANAYIDVPANATSLTVAITNGSGDLDLYLKYGAPVTGSTVSDLNRNADFRSDSAGANETITITPASVPPLKGGKWYMATLCLNNTKTTFTLTATYQVPGTGGPTQPVPAVPIKSSAPVSMGTLTPMPGVPGPTETKHTFSLKSDPDVAIPGTYLDLGYVITPGTAVGDADLYFVVILPDGTPIFFGSQGPFDPVPVYRKAIPLPGKLQDFILYDLPLPDTLPLGTYTFASVLVRAGNNFLDVANWVSDVAVDTLYFSPLSPSQEAMIKNYGRPSRFIKTFDTPGGRIRVDESWQYSGAGAILSFTNGVLVGVLADTGPAPAVLAGLNSETFTFTNTAQGIMQRFGQPGQITGTYDIGGLSGLIAMDKFFVYDSLVFGFRGDALMMVMTKP